MVSRNARPEEAVCRGKESVQYENRNIGQTSGFALYLAFPIRKFCDFWA